MWLQRSLNKWHNPIAQYALGSDECNLLLIRLVHGYLVVTSVCIQKAHMRVTQSRVHQLIDFWQREAVFRTSSVEACEIHSHSPFAYFFLYHDCVG